MIPSRKRLELSLDSAIRIYWHVRESCIHNYDNLNDGDIPPRTASKIVGLAFLGVVVAWEDFVEDCFARYMCGANAGNGYAPFLRIGPAKDRKHAYQLLDGHQARPDTAKIAWGSAEFVRATAKVFFKDGEPFESALQKYRFQLEAAVTIRNRIAHASPRAKKAFGVVARKMTARKDADPLPQGYSPGRLLIESCTDVLYGDKWLDSRVHHWGDYFEAFIAMYLELAEAIAPSPPQATPEIAPTA